MTCDAGGIGALDDALTRGRTRGQAYVDLPPRRQPPGAYSTASLTASSARSTCRPSAATGTLRCAGAPPLPWGHAAPPLGDRPRRDADKSLWPCNVESTTTPSLAPCVRRASRWTCSPGARPPAARSTPPPRVRPLRGHPARQRAGAPGRGGRAHDEPLFIQGITPTSPSSRSSM